MDAIKNEVKKLIPLAAQFQGLQDTFQVKTAYASLHQSRVRYRVLGQGEHTLVFCPDPPNVIEHYEALAQMLASQYRVVIFEWPGFGFSLPTQIDFDFRVESNAKVAAELLEQLDLPNYTLCFSCVSVFSALKVAEMHPDLIHKLVLIQAPSWEEELKWVKVLDPQGVITQPHTGQAFLEANQQMVANQWYQFAVAQQHLRSDFQQTSQAAFEQGACYCLASGLQAMVHAPAPIFSSVEHATLVLWGMKDRSHAQTDKTSIQNYLQKYEWAEFEEAGHFPELEEKEKFQKLMQDFI